MSGQKKGEEGFEAVLLGHGQEHLLPFIEADASRNLERQLEALDWAVFEGALDQCVRHGGGTALPDEYGPAPYLPFEPETGEQAALYQKARARGAELLSAGKAAAFTVAGGQGTRLGFDGPKGTLPVSPLASRSLFEIFALKILAARRRYDAPMPWLIMCSPLNIVQTRDFFDSKGWFGLGHETIRLFVQGTMPAVDFNGRLLLETPSGLALSPDGHGGSLRALIESGSIEWLKNQGIDHISYFQVDNPLVEPADELFLGLHGLTGSDMSSRSLTKTGPLEKLGNFAVAGGKLTIIEYSDLPEERSRETGPDGRLLFRAGSPAIHMIRRDFVESFASGGAMALPFHRAEKKISCIDTSCRPERGAETVAVRKKEEKGVKFETFVFDALPMARDPLILETLRSEQFSPVKNPSGVDSLESCRADMLAKDTTWLRRAGFVVPEDCRIEISPLAASRPDDLARFAGDLGRLKAGSDYLVEPGGVAELGRL